MAIQPATWPFRTGRASRCLALSLALACAQAGGSALGAQANLSPLGAEESSAAGRGATESGSPASAAPLIVAWCELESANAPAEYGYLSSSLPLLLRGATLFADSRLLSAREAAALGGRARELERALAHDALIEAIRARDALALRLRDGARRRQELRVAEDALALARARYDALGPGEGQVEAPSPGQDNASVNASVNASLNAAAPDAADSGAAAAGSAEATRRLTPWQGAEGVPLAAAKGVASTAAELSEYCEAKGIDYLFYGGLKSAGSFLQLELALFSAAQRDTLWRGVEYCAPDALDGLAELFIRPAASALMGRAYARLFLDTEPPQAALRIEGGGALSQGQLFFEESTMRLILSAPGYDTLVMPLRMEPGSDLILTASLDKRQRGRFTVDSDDPGASVYLAGEYLGTVPLELEGFADTKTLRVSAPGKSPLQLPLKGSPPSGSLVLPPLEDMGIGYKLRLGEAKDQFYGALGYFVLSLPVSVLSFGSFRMYYDAGAAALQSGIPDQEYIDSLNTRYVVSQSLFWASSAVSAGLAVNAAIKLARYIRASN